MPSAHEAAMLLRGQINHNLRSGLARLMLLEYPYLPFRPRRSKCD